MGISSFVIGIVVGVVVASVGLGEVIVILKEVIAEATPVVLGLI